MLNSGTSRILVWVLLGYKGRAGVIISNQLLQTVFIKMNNSKKSNNIVKSIKWNTTIESGTNYQTGKQSQKKGSL